MSELPLVTVIMPVRNEAAFIGRSLGAVLAQDYGLDRLEVIVADGMSTDGTREAVYAMQKPGAAVRLIDNPGRIAPTGLNAAMAHARGQIIVRVDGHCEIAPDYVRRCVERLRQDHVDGVGGPLETVGQTPQARVIAVATSSPFGVGGSAFRTIRHKTLMVDTIAFPAYRRSTIERAGPYDEELVRNQDDEYNYRLREMGACLLLAADVRSRYYSRGTLGLLWRQYFQYGYWKVRVMQKHPRQMRLRQFVPAALVAALLVTLVTGPWIALSRWLTLLLIAAYLAANLSASTLAARRHGWWMLPWLPLAFAALHFAYGFGFLAGLIGFWNRWGDRGAAAAEKGPGGGSLA
jgi:glycosyltransferase involved in cell wall biosynthesis